MRVGSVLFSLSTLQKLDIDVDLSSDFTVVTTDGEELSLGVDLLLKSLDIDAFCDLGGE